MKQIHITLDNNGTVTFETVSIDNTETVFFTNMDTTEPHWPTLASNQVGPAPSPNSSQCPVPAPLDNTKTPPVAKTPPYDVTYKCKIKGHELEQGIVKVFALLAPAANTVLAQATQGKAITEQPVVVGGKSPYAIPISGQLFQITDANGKVIQSGSGIGPGLKLNPQNNNGGITVTGTPTVVGTYGFTFTVNDAMGRNLQQVQYSMKVVAPGVA
jgi:hypothetical protein